MIKLGYTKANASVHASKIEKEAREILVCFFEIRFFFYIYIHI